MTRLARLSAAVTLLALAALPVRAADVLGFDADALARAQAQGRTILVLFHADWSLVSRDQRRVVDRLRREAVFREAAVFIADFEASPEARRSLQVRSPGTILVYKGRHLVARTIGETAESTLRSLWAKGL